MGSQKNKFNFRSFISFFILFVFLILAVTGIILYFTPHGKHARWTGWEFFGLSKDNLEGIHTVFSFVFIIASIYHVFYFNLKVVWKNLKSRAKNGLNRKKELVCSLVLTILIFGGSYLLLPPFSSIINIGEELKKSWEKFSILPPIPDAHKLSICALSKDVLKKDLKTVLKILRFNSIKIESQNQSLLDIAIKNNTSPSKIYSILKSGIPSNPAAADNPPR